MEPLSPPIFQTPVRKFWIEEQTASQGAGPFGSTTAHCAPSRDRLLEQNHEATGSSELIVRILPGGAVARRRDSPPENTLDDINAERVERVSFRGSEILRKSGDSREKGICRCDPDPARSVRLRVNSGEMPARGNGYRGGSVQGKKGGRRVVKDSVGGVNGRLKRSSREDRLRRLKDADAILAFLTMRSHDSRRVWNGCIIRATENGHCLGIQARGPVRGGRWWRFAR